MYPSKGGNSYNQQPYSTQQAYGQIPGSAYGVGGPDARQAGLSATQEADIGGYRSHSSQASQYGGPYASVYGSSSLSSAQQVGGVSSNRGYSQKADQYSLVASSDYASLDRRHYTEAQGSYSGRDLPSDSVRRYPDPVSLSHQHQPEIHDHLEQTSLLRQQQILKAQSLQSGSDISSFSVDDDDYCGYDYDLIGQLSEVQIVYLNCFVEKKIKILPGANGW